jgi:ankyrin repeat protein
MRELGTHFSSDLDVALPNGWSTPLHLAVGHAKSALIPVLVSLGCNIDLFDDQAETPLLEAIRLAIESRKTPDRKRAFDNAKSLIELGANVNLESRGPHPHTPFTRVVAGLRYDLTSSHQKIKALMKLLKDKGADINAVTNDGDTALIRLCRMVKRGAESTSISKYILILINEFGASPNCSGRLDHRDQSLMHFALHNPALRSICPKLAESGARLATSEFDNVFSTWFRACH